MRNHRPLAALDHIRQHSERAGETVVALREDIHVGALRPGEVRRRVDRGLDVLAVEVDGRGLFLGEGAAGSFWLSATSSSPCLQNE